MNNAIAEQFRIALNYLLHREGRGAQVRLALTQNIDRGYLNAVTKGRKPAAEEIRIKIAEHFSMEYVDMLTLGRGLQEGHTCPPAVANIVTVNQAEVKRTATETAYDGQTGKTARAIQQTLELLGSGTAYGDALSQVVAALHQAMVVSGAKRVDPEYDRLQAMEERLAQLEAGVLKKRSGKR